MRVVFMGTPAFAVPSLRALEGEHDVVLVVTRPDRAAGRGSELRPSPVKQAARSLGLPIAQPSALAGDATRQIAALDPDVICVAAFGMLLPPETLEAARLGCVNVHASLLPRHRGAAPIQRAILDGDEETGVSIMLMEAGLDTGPYALRRVVPVDGRSAIELEADLAQVGAHALLEVLHAMAEGTAVWTPQDERLATYAAKVTKDDVALVPDITAAAADLRVRASTRSAPARACVGERDITVVRARPAEFALEPGSLCVRDGEPVLGFADGGLVLETVRPAGRGDMPGSDWARGARLGADACWRCAR